MQAETKFAIGAGCLVVSLALALLIRITGAAVIRREAVTEGVARWVADESGSAVFEWITPDDN